MRRTTAIRVSPAQSLVGAALLAVSLGAAWTLPGWAAPVAERPPATAAATNAIPALKVGDRFPNLADFGIEGDLPADVKGKVVIVDFWASWCGPCQESFPLMEDLYRRYRERGLRIVAVNVDESKAAMKAFLAENPVSFVVVRDAKRKLVAQVNVTAMPTSFLLDGDGVVRYLHPGYKGHETKRLYTREIEILLGIRGTNQPAKPPQRQP
jgi:thiol-disulfide isomerase/thioredoxin